jgi:hypothetical protein
MTKETTTLELTEEAKREKEIAKQSNIHYACAEFYDIYQKILGLKDGNQDMLGEVNERDKYCLNGEIDTLRGIADEIAQTMDRMGCKHNYIVGKKEKKQAINKAWGWGISKMFGNEKSEKRLKPSDYDQWVLDPNPPWKQ